MGEVFLLRPSSTLLIHAVFYFYGDAATHELSLEIARDISDHWNEPGAEVWIGGTSFRVQFQIEGLYDPQLQPETVWYNDHPANNYFRIEEFSASHISFVDGLGSNTGYFKRDNLLNRSTTAAHEFGHTIGLDHPRILDIRGKGQPGIMYPRGTLCDPVFQYDPNAAAGQPGGTLNPATRKVLQGDIDLLRLDRLSFDAAGRSVVGGFSSLFHAKHQA